MPDNTTTIRQPDTHIPHPDGNRWGTWLTRQDTPTDREYRIIVDGNIVVYQYGHRGASGDTTVKRYTSAENACVAARKAWATKEANGYHSMCGPVPLTIVPPPHAAGQQFANTITLHLRNIANCDTRDTINGTCNPDDIVWVLGMPAIFHGTLIPNLYAHGHHTGCTTGTHDLHGDDILITPAPPALTRDIRAVFPIAIPIGTWSDGKDATALAHLTKAVAATIPARPNHRERLAEAIELAHALM